MRWSQIHSSFKQIRHSQLCKCTKPLWLVSTYFSLKPHILLALLCLGCHLVVQMFFSTFPGMQPKLSNFNQIPLTALSKLFPSNFVLHFFSICFFYLLVQKNKRHHWTLIGSNSPAEFGLSFIFRCKHKI